MSLREAVNVSDLLKRDRLVRRFQRIRRNAVLEKNTLEHWNESHPNEQPFSTAFEEAIIQWCDTSGDGPPPNPKDFPT